jgi:hypothetical protein
MKMGKIVIVLSCLIIVTICTINVQKSFFTAKKAGYYNLNSILNTAQAEDEGAPTSCEGSECDDANGNKYNTLTVGDKVTCCGVYWLSRGNKSS